MATLLIRLRERRLPASTRQPVSALLKSRRLRRRMPILRSRQLEEHSIAGGEPQPLSEASFFVRLGKPFSTAEMNLHGWKLKIAENLSARRLVQTFPLLQAPLSIGARLRTSLRVA